MTSIEWFWQQIKKSSCTYDDVEKLFEQAKEMHKAETQIPNDEIFKAALDYDNMTSYDTPIAHFQMGAFWYREQLKQRQ